MWEGLAAKQSRREDTSKNRPGHQPPQRPGTKKNAQEAPSNLYELTFLVWGSAVQSIKALLPFKQGV
jgi:hypothetical protein